MYWDKLPPRQVEECRHRRGNATIAISLKYRPFNTASAMDWHPRPAVLWQRTQIDVFGPASRTTTFSTLTSGPPGGLKTLVGFSHPRCSAAASKEFHECHEKW